VAKSTQARTSGIPDARVTPPRNLFTENGHCGFEPEQEEIAAR